MIAETPEAIELIQKTAVQAAGPFIVPNGLGHEYLVPDEEGVLRPRTTDEQVQSFLSKGLPGTTVLCGKI